MPGSLGHGPVAAGGTAVFSILLLNLWLVSCTLMLV